MDTEKGAGIGVYIGMLLVLGYRTMPIVDAEFWSVGGEREWRDRRGTNQIQRSREKSLFSKLLMKAMDPSSHRLHDI